MTDPVTATDIAIVSVIEKAIVEHERELDQTACPTGYCACNQQFATDELHAAHQARAVLDAISEAGNVEWGVFRKRTGTRIGQVSFESAEQAEAWAKENYYERFSSQIEPRPRITFPWNRSGKIASGKP